MSLRTVPFSREARIKYYARAALTKRHAVVDDEAYRLWYYDKGQNPVPRRFYGYTSIGAARGTPGAIQNYYRDLDALLPPRVGVLFQHGDVWTSMRTVCVTKTRPVECQQNVLLPLNWGRHLGTIPHARHYDIPFHEKDDKIVWRGATTGWWRGQRRELVVRWAKNENPLIDVGVSQVVQRVGDAGVFLKPKLSIQEQLRSKFILSVEGNDVATNMKWIAASNSVLVMPAPTICSWVMEDHMTPWVHYVPVAHDFSDLEDKHRWCLEHPQECERIALEGKEYISQFENFADQQEIAREVLRVWSRNVKLELPPGATVGSGVVNAYARQTVAEKPPGV